jgi:hypothetical protein
VNADESYIPCETRYRIANPLRTSAPSEEIKFVLGNQIDVVLNVIFRHITTGCGH